MAGLLDPLSDLQQQLVDGVAEVFLRYRRWPIFDYIEKRLERVPADANQVIASLPTIDRVFGVGSYSAVWTTGGSNDRAVQLTVLGLHHSKQLHRDPRHPPIEDAFFEVLRHLIYAYSSAEPSPFEVKTVVVDAEEIARVLREAKQDGLTLELLFELMKHEPPTAYGNATEREGGAKAWIVTRHVMDYEGVGGVSDYVECVRKLAPPPPRSPAPPLPPNALPEALDFLDAVWRLVPGHNEALLRLFSTERAARLAGAVSTEEELASALSALGEVLASLRVPKQAAPGSGRRSRSVSDPALQDLQTHLHDLLATDAHERIDDAVETLQQVVQIRHGAHHGHVDPRSRAAMAYQQLGVGVGQPPPVAWETVRRTTVAALQSIRDELAPLTRGEAQR